MNKNYLPFLPFLLSIDKKMSEKNIPIFYKNIFENQSIIITSMKKNTFLVCFLKKLKTDIFKNVKNRIFFSEWELKFYFFKNKNNFKNKIYFFKKIK